MELDCETDTAVLKFFSPVPMWARRRWDMFGEVVTSKGSLFAYRFDRAELDEEIQFAMERMWLSRDKKGELH